MTRYRAFPHDGGPAEVYPSPPSGGGGVRSPGSLRCFLKDGEDPGKTRDRLRVMNINIHGSRSPRAPALDLPVRGLGALVRASVPYYDDESETERFIRAVAGFAEAQKRVAERRGIPYTISYA
jgi:selenocysteine lyase/cysteine desulfurase